MASKKVRQKKRKNTSKFFAEFIRDTVKRVIKPKNLTIFKDSNNQVVRIEFEE